MGPFFTGRMSMCMHFHIVGSIVSGKEVTKDGSECSVIQLTI